MRRICSLAALAALAACAGASAAQGTMTYLWTVSDTGNGNGTLTPGESVLLALWARMDPEVVGFAGSICDIRGIRNWAEGTLDWHHNLLYSVTEDVVFDDNSIRVEAFQLPPLFNPSFDASNPIELYRLQWTPDDYTPHVVEVGDANHLNNDVYTDNFGSSAAYDSDPGVARFQVVPGPGAWAPLTLAGLAVGCARGARAR